MRRVWRPARLVIAALAMAAAGGVAAQEARRASNGIVVPTPDIEELDCAAMQATLDALDGSNYRDAAPVPEGHPDREIYEYENDLSVVNYQDCIVEETVLQDAAEAFDHGFESAAPSVADTEAATAGIPAASAPAAVALPAAPVAAGAAARTGADAALGAISDGEAEAEPAAEPAEAAPADDHQ